MTRKTSDLQPRTPPARYRVDQETSDTCASLVSPRPGERVIPEFVRVKPKVSRNRLRGTSKTNHKTPIHTPSNGRPATMARTIVSPSQRGFSFHCSAVYPIVSSAGMLANAADHSRPGDAAGQD